MQPIIVCDWTTVRGNGVTVIQDASRWIRSAVFQDIFFAIDVREIGGAATTITMETAPARDDVLFQPMFTPFTPAVGLTGNFKSVFLSSASVPVSEWSRWKVVLAAGAVNDITFRVLAYGNRLC